MLSTVLPVVLDTHVVNCFAPVVLDILCMAYNMRLATDDASS